MNQLVNIKVKTTYQYFCQSKLEPKLKPKKIKPKQNRIILLFSRSLSVFGRYISNMIVLGQPRNLLGTLPYCMKKLAGLLVCLVLALNGCASKPTEEERQRSEQSYFASAQKALKSKNYFLAIEQLQQLESRFPFGRYAPQAQLDLVFAYYQSLDYDNARLAARRFVRLNPNHSELDYAYYLEALSAFEIDRGFLSRILPSSASERDLAPLYDAYRLLSRFVSDYPQSRYFNDARQRMLYIRNLLAEHELRVASYYMDRQAYLAAANRGRYIIERFPKAPAVESALEYMIRAYFALDMLELSASTKRVLIANYPENQHIINGAYVFKEAVRNDERSWLNIMTFGLIGK